MKKNIKKLVLIIMIFFGISINTYADNYVIENPKHNNNPLGWADNLSDENKQYTASTYCNDNGFSDFVSYNLEDNSSDTVSYYDLNSASWKTEDLSILNTGKLMNSITCTDGISNNGGLMIDGDLDPKLDMELITINSGKIYINKDNLFYLVVTISVILLLFRSVLYIFVLSFNVSKRLVQGKGLNFKK